MKTIIKKYKTEIILAALLCATYHVWLIPAGYLAAGDWAFHFREQLRGFMCLPQIWNAMSAFGSTDVMPSFDVFKMIYGTLARLGLDYNILERIVYFYPVLIFEYIGVLKLGKRIFRSDKVALFIFALFYFFNTYILSVQTSYITYAGVYALAPLILYFFIKIGEAKKFDLANTIILGALLFLASSYEPRGLVVLAFFMFFYFVYTLIENKKRVFTICLRYAVPCLICIALSSYWIVYMLFSKGSVAGVNARIAQTVFAGYNTILDSITMHNYAWQGNVADEFVMRPFHQINTSFYMLIFPIVAFSSLFFLKRGDRHSRHFIIFLSFASLVGMFLLKQQNEPYGAVYLWLFQHFPLFKMFRESNKFIVFLALPLSLLLGRGFSFWYHAVSRVWLRRIFIVLFSAVILFNVKPLVTGEIKTLFVSKNIPNDYIIFKNHIINQDDYYRTLWTPANSGWGISADDHPIIGNASIINSSWKKFMFSIAELIKMPTEERIMEIFKYPYSNYLFDVSTVKYVVVARQDNDNDAFFINYGGVNNTGIRQWYVSELDKISWLKKVDIGTKDIVVYENENYYPHVYSAPGLNYYQSNVSEFGNIDENQNIYWNADAEKNNYLLNKLSGAIVPVEADPDTIADKQAAVDAIADAKEKRTAQSALDVYKKNLFFSDYQLNIPVGGTYKIYFKSDSVLAGNRNIGVQIGNTVLIQKFASNKKSDWKYFNQIELGSGKYDLKIYLGNQSAGVINSGDVVFYAEDLSAPIKTPKLEYKQVSPTKYVVNVRGASESFPLIFSENFHSGWKIYVQPNLAGPGTGKFIGEENHGTTQNDNLLGGKFYDIFNREPVLDDKHFIINNFANAWWVDLDELRKSGKIKLNRAGTYDFSVYVEFEPQKYFYIGLGISILATLACLGCLGGCLFYKFRRKRYNKINTNKEAREAQTKV